MALFGKKEVKKEITSSAAPTGVPVETVLQMRQQGLTNDQIVQALQRNGYRSSQIFDAMNQADLATAAPQQPQIQPQPEPTFEEAIGVEPVEEKVETDYSEQIEELAEAIIEEKWQELLKDINKIIEWKKAVEERIAKVEQRFDDLQKNYDNLQKAVVAKIGEYDQNIKSVGTDIKAVEQVFKKLLPSFTANVNELRRVTKGLKAKKK